MSSEATHCKLRSSFQNMRTVPIRVPLESYSKTGQSQMANTCHGPGSRQWSQQCINRSEPFGHSQFHPLVVSFFLVSGLYSSIMQKSKPHFCAKSQVSLPLDLVEPMAVVIFGVLLGQVQGNGVSLFVAPP